MKNILLITIREEIGQMYTAEFEKLFSEYANIITYSFENKSNETFNKARLENMDVVVITSNNVFSLIRNHIDEDTPIVYVHFTFMQEKIDLLKAYPRDTNAYIGFKSYSASFETVSLLYELGLNNLNLRVYDPIYTNINDIDVAIISENSNIFPEKVKNILSIGKRKISFMTIMDIATGLGIMDDNLENRIYSYCRGMAVHDNCLNYFYGKSSNIQIQLQTIIDCIDDAFIMVNHNYTVLNHNTQLLNMFKIDRSIYNANMAAIPEFSEIFDIIISPGELKNELITLPRLNKKVLLSRERIKDKDYKYEIFILIIKDMTKVLDLENTLRRQLAKKGHVAKYNFNNIKGESLAVKKAITKAKKIAAIDKPTLIIGESGTGKELFAQSIHNKSVRSKFPFVAVNCAALTSSLLESELFGYEEGSFTGAKKGGKTGFFEMAHKGTLFLDEICEMSLETQAKLLRVLEEKEIMKVGGNEIISIDVRIIAATNKNIQSAVEEGSFRLDLFFRLNTVMLNVPSLVERYEDIEILSQDFLKDLGFNNKKIHKDVMDFMLSYSWKGNVRELRNCIEYMASISEGMITMEHLPEYMLMELESEKSVNQYNNYDNGNTGYHENKAALKTLEALMKRNMGRRSLLDILRSQNIPISEYKLRSIMDGLKRNGYINFEKGRSGAVITTLGKDALQRGKIIFLG